MTVYAVMNTKDDGDIVEACIRHTLAEGIDHVLVSDMHSSDGTREILASLEAAGRVTVFDDPAPIHYQSESMTRLAALAGAAGAEWVLPVDADEFWIAHDGSVREALDALPPSVTRVYATMWQHHDWDHREPQPKPQPKCAFRWQPGSIVVLGNHDVDKVVGDAARNVLQVREIQYRSFEQFAAKIAKQNATFDPSLGPGHGTHHKQYRDLTDAQLREVWDRMRSVPTVEDPIRTRAAL